MTDAEIESDIRELAAGDGQYAIAYALLKCALWLKYLGTGDNASQMGAIEFLAVKVADAINSKG
jgi:hypothetical protein